MHTLKISTFCLLILSSINLWAQEAGKHLFLLSGQSNMARFKHKDLFNPGIYKALGEENVIIIREAQGGQPISQWYKNWKSSKGEVAKKKGLIYDKLMTQTKEAIADKKIATVTFIWMQGEADSKAGNGDVYLESLKGLQKQLEDDLDRKDINFVIGRLSDSGFFKKGTIPRENPNWAAVQKAQMDFAEQNPRAYWIDTDDFNGKKNELHYIKPEGYKRLGEAYVEVSLQALKEHAPKAVNNI
jgi:hypothetical protein